MKITGNISGNRRMMEFAPLALALAATVIFFCNLYAHIWNGAMFYFPLLYLALYGKRLVKVLSVLFFVLLFINLICPYSFMVYFLFMAVSAASFFIGILNFILGCGK